MKSAGGALGQVTGKDIAPDLSSMSAAMALGTLYPVPVPSWHGYRVLPLNQKAEGRVTLYTAVEMRIRQRSRTQACRAATLELIAEPIAVESGPCVFGMAEQRDNALCTAPGFLDTRHD